MHIQQNFNVKLVIVISVLSNTWNVIKGRVPEKHKRKFPGGFYSNPQSVFDKLDQFGIYAEEKDRFYVWFLVYDFEYILVPIKIKNTDNLEYTEHHVPISVSICSNVNEYTAPHCIIEPNADDLVKKMVTYMLTIAKNATELTRTKFSNVFEAL